jgi:hypothetical protein
LIRVTAADCCTAWIMPRVSWVICRKPARSAAVNFPTVVVAAGAATVPGGLAGSATARPAGTGSATTGSATAGVEGASSEITACGCREV